MTRTPASLRLTAVLVGGAALVATAGRAQQAPTHPPPPEAVPGVTLEQPQPPVAVERTVGDAPLAPGPNAFGGDELGVGPTEPAPVDLDTDVRPGQLVHVPVTHVYPGAVEPVIDLDIPDLDDPARIWRGKQWFVQFNCAGCHAPNGGGGMGISLSNTTFKYGQDPENIYLSILQGRPLGMPVWGGFLPDHVIWDLVAYIRKLARDGTGWGTTISLDALTIEQIPSQYIETIEPWQHTTRFSYGQPPFKKVETPDKEEPDDAAPDN